MRAELIAAKEAYDRLLQESAESESALIAKYEAAIDEEKRKLEERYAVCSEIECLGDGTSIAERLNILRRQSMRRSGSLNTGV